MAGIDWSSYSNNKEKKARDGIQTIARSEVFDTPQKRVKEYSHEKKRKLDPNEEY